MNEILATEIDFLRTAAAIDLYRLDKVRDTK
jgi:hypothetical protein